MGLVAAVGALRKELAVRHSAALTWLSEHDLRRKMLFR